MSENTRDLSKFGYREHDLAGALLKACAQGSQAWASENDTLSDGVAVEFNPNSGEVFLVDDDGNVAMINDDGKLENWLSCPNCGAESFRSDDKIKFTDDGYCYSCHEKGADL